MREKSENFLGMEFSPEPLTPEELGTREARMNEKCPHCGGDLNISSDRYCDGWMCQEDE